MRIPTSGAGMFALMGSLVVGLAFSAVSARAQDLPLAQVLPELILREITLAPTFVGAHVAHFSPLTNEVNNPVIGIVQGFNTQMATQFSTFPLGSSSGGMTYVFDESVGTFTRGSASFGPLFAERALTIGRRKVNAGFTYQHTSYDTFEGQPLDDGSIKFYLTHQDCCHFPDPTTFTDLVEIPDGSRFNPPFEGDLIEAALSVRASTDTMAAFANYGVSDRWDIGLAVPLVSVNLDVGVRARIIRLSTPLAPEVHTFEAGNPAATQALRRSGHASGLGDVVLRTKYRFLGMAAGGLAAAVDVRLPTGDEDELLGTGGVQGKVLLVASNEGGRFGQHVNIGYTVARGDVAGTVAGLSATSLPDEINYSGGLEFIASPRLTLMGDVIGRTLRHAGRLAVASKAFEYSAGASFAGGPGPGCAGVPGRTCTTASFDEFSPRPGNLTLLLGAGGVKFNPVGNWLISASVLFPRTDAGLRSRVTTTVGVDYAF